MHNKIKNNNELRDGHTNVKTTQIYAHIVDKSKRDAADVIHIENLTPTNDDIERVPDIWFLPVLPGRASEFSGAFLYKKESTIISSAPLCMACWNWTNLVICGYYPVHLLPLSDLNLNLDATDPQITRH